MGAARRPADADHTVIDEVSHQRKRFDLHAAPCGHRVYQRGCLLVGSDYSSRLPSCPAESADPGPGHHGLGSPGGSACPHQRTRLGWFSQLRSRSTELVYPSLRRSRLESAHVYRSATRSIVSLTKAVAISESFLPLSWE
jgi:hypothetical protein